MKRKTFVSKLLTLLIALVITISCSSAIRAQASPNEGVINLSVYALYGEGDSSSSGGDGLGHAWIVVENGTENMYNFYNTRIVGGETFSIGTWGNRFDPNTGKTVKKAWLNLESYFQMVGDNTVSLTIEITEEQLETVNKKCIELNKWSVVNNCSYFASHVWNEVAPEGMKVNSYFFPANFPKTLKASIKKISGYQTNRKIDKNSFVGYCDSPTSFKHIRKRDIEPLALREFGQMIAQSNRYSSFPIEYDSYDKLFSACA